MSGPRARGFTLLEVLIALAILAVALAAASRAASVAADGSFALRQRLLAEWVAQNRLAELRLPQPASAASTNRFAAGETSGEESQGANSFRWTQTLSDTANASIKRVEIRVFLPNDPSYALATLVGYLATQ